MQRQKNESFGIKRFKVIQTTVNDLEVQIIADKLSLKRTEDLISNILTSVGETLNVEIKYVDSFPNYKFEEFVSLVKNLNS